MLSHLTVRNFAIVDRLELDLGPGMTVLTGETGAGKSILVDALTLALGDRASGSAVRSGCDRAEVSASFDLSSLPVLKEWLADQDLDDREPQCILRRSVTPDGRSRAFINGQPVPLHTMRSVASRLVDIHGQQAHQSLLRSAVQRQILDDFASHANHLEALSSLSRQWSNLRREMEGCTAGDDGQDARLDLLRYQVKELKDLRLSPDEPEQLAEEHRRLSHLTELLEACHGSLQTIGGDSELTVLTQLEGVARTLRGLQTYDSQLGEVADLLDNAVVHAREAAGELRRYLNTLDLDPDRLRYVEDRLSAIHEAGRKHRVHPDDLCALEDRLTQEIQRLEAGEDRVRQLQQQLDAVEQEYLPLAKRLGEGRLRAAETLSGEVTSNMQRLGMPGGRFKVAVNRRTAPAPSPVGADEIEFLVSANPGQPLQPLARVASGGELSRIALAIQVIAAQGTGVPTLIFDEVDAGIGGRVAEIVGQQLRLLGNARQVLCITHLPQVASQAHHHLQVRKRTQQDSTWTSLANLGGDDRVQEIARMLGGLRITDQALAHAREMLDPP